MSRFTNSPDILYKGRETKGRISTYSWLVERPEPQLIRTYKVTTQTAGSPRRIASQLYGDHNLWWIITSFNNRWYPDPGSLQVLNWPKAGQIIYYPVRVVFSATIS